MAEESFGEKTEPATPRKREEARKKGQVAKSQDLTSALILLAALLAFEFFGVEVLGSYYAPGLVTVYQVNFRVPENAREGDRNLNMSADGVFSQNTLLPIRR